MALTAQEREALPRTARLLEGKHIHITTVEESGKMEMHDSSGEWREDSSKWEGFLVDQIKWISEKAGFTYTLHAPSGLGASCNPAPGTIYGTNNDTFPVLKPFKNETWHTQYLCAEEDVHTLNFTDVYWGMFYITNKRSQKNFFTLPFVSNVGLTITVKKDPEKNLFEKLSTPFRPFALDMWLAILATAVGGALFMWIIEHSNTDDKRYYPKRSRHLTPMEYNHILRKESGFHRKPDGGGEEHGFFSVDSFKKFFLRYLESGFLTLTGHSVYTPATSSGRLLNLFYCIFALLLTSTYTANLATFLISDESTNLQFKDVKGLAQESEKLNKFVCTPGGTANAAWTETAFPNMKTLQKMSVAGMVEGLLNDECIAFLSPRSIGQYELHNNCPEGKQTVEILGTPLEYGFTDMAVGVHQSRYDIVETLDFWLNELKQCSTNDMSSMCYNSKNMAGLWHKFVETGDCGKVAEEQESFHRFTFDDFISIFGIMWLMGLFAIFHAMWKNRALLLLRMTKKKHLLTWLRENYPAYYDDDQFLVEKWIEKVWQEKKGDGDFMHDCMMYTQAFFLRTDVNTWRLLTLTLRRLLKNIGIIAVKKNAGEKIHNEAYMMAIIVKSQETLEILVRRALIESSELDTMTMIEKERVKAERIISKEEVTLSEKMAAAMTGRDRASVHFDRRRSLMLGKMQLGANPAFMHASYYNKPSFKEKKPLNSGEDIEMSAVKLGLGEGGGAEVPDAKEKGWVRRHDPNYGQDYFENEIDGRVTWTPQRLDSDLAALSEGVEGGGDDKKETSTTSETNFDKFMNFFDMSRISLSRDGMIEERATVKRFETSPL
ncbi:hypothetical protein TrVE_jg14473 [Triparma verrucosa]|uniref:Ionotropic glutamate receptor C-terminal domain-containing protein n=1 Tax=Triparma verrucosa TaxID=1606542 RepID=A0A9W6Z758_9STRA|nr:hypothetical protein TrVE_jg14473 [Triparma verrucosa]